MANHELDAVVDDLVGNGNGLFRIARVVVDHAFELGAVDAAGLVDLFDGHLGADELHLTVLSNGTGHRTGQADLDVVGRHRIAGRPRQCHCREQLGNLLSSLVHECSTLVFFVVVVLAAEAAEPGPLPR